MKFEKPRLFLFQRQSGGKPYYHGEFPTIQEVEKHVSKFIDGNTFHVRIILGAFDGGVDIAQLVANYPPEACILAIANSKEKREDVFTAIFGDIFSPKPVSEPDVFLFISVIDEFPLLGGKLDKDSLLARLVKLAN